jgi:hypothetical protein
VNHSKSHNKISVWLHEDQVPKVATEIKRDPYKAWQKVKDIPGALKFLGGKSFAPKDTTDIKCYTISRAPVGADSMMPRFTVAHLEMDRGICGRRASDADDLERTAAADASDCGSSIPK